jgi:uncharacterized membrane protein
MTDAKTVPWSVIVSVARYVALGLAILVLFTIVKLWSMPPETQVSHFALAAFGAFIGFSIIGCWDGRGSQ